MKEQPEKIVLSEEQQEQKEKFLELLTIMSDLRGFLVFDDEAYEVREAIKDFKINFEKEGLKLDGYLAGRALLISEDSFPESNYPYDTEDGQIESFIRHISEYQKKKDEFSKKNLPK